LRRTSYIPTSQTCLEARRLRRLCPEHIRRLVAVGTRRICATVSSTPIEIGYRALRNSRPVVAQDALRCRRPTPLALLLNFTWYTQDDLRVAELEIGCHGRTRVADVGDADVRGSAASVRTAVRRRAPRETAIVGASWECITCIAAVALVL